MSTSKEIFVFLDGQVMREGAEHDYVLGEDGMPQFNFVVDVQPGRKESQLLLQIFQAGLFVESRWYTRKHGQWMPGP